MPGGPTPASSLIRVIVRVELRVVLPLVGRLVLGEAGIHRAGLDAGIAVDALLRVDVEPRDVVVVRLIGRRMDAVDRADLDARIVLSAYAGLADDVGHGVSGSSDVRGQSGSTLGGRAR